MTRQRPLQDGTPPEETSAPSSRDRVLDAALEMFAQDTSASLSVRAVAERAGVSAGSLRYHFPTQRSLHDAVFARLYDQVAADDPLHDRSLTPRERLLGCIQQMLMPQLTRDELRESWRTLAHTYILGEQTPESTDSYRAIERESLRRLEHWLRVLAEDGALDPAHISERAHFLFTVLNGISLERALPSSTSALEHAPRSLEIALDAVLDGPAAQAAQAS